MPENAPTSIYGKKNPDSPSPGQVFHLGPALFSFRKLTDFDKQYTTIHGNDLFWAVSRLGRPGLLFNLGPATHLAYRSYCRTTLSLGFIKFSQPIFYHNALNLSMCNVSSHLTDCTAAALLQTQRIFTEFGTPEFGLWHGTPESLRDKHILFYIHQVLKENRKQLTLKSNRVLIER